MNKLSSWNTETRFTIATKQLFYLFFAPLIVVLISFRVFGIDRDYTRYQNFFERAGFGADGGRFEPGFQFLANITKFMFGADSFQLFLLLVTFLALMPKFYILNKSRNYVITVVVYSFIVLPLHEMTQLRVAVALGIVYYGIYLSVNDRISLKYRLLFLLAAISMHISAIMLTPFLIIPNFFSKRGSIKPIALILLMTVSLNLIIPLMAKIMFIVWSYLNYEELRGVANPLSARNLVFLSLVFIGFIQIKKFPNKVLPWYYMSIFGLCMWYSVSWIPIIAHRCLELTIFSYLVWVPYLSFQLRLLAFSMLWVLSSYLLYRNIFVSSLLAS